MKSMHFCTEKNIKKLTSQEGYLTTLRTGWIPQIFVGDIIKLKERSKTGDKLITTGEIISVTPIKFKDIKNNTCNEEILRYKRKFHAEQYFFRIIIKLQKKGDD